MGDRVIVTLPNGIGEHSLNELLKNWSKAGHGQYVPVNPYPRVFEIKDGEFRLPAQNIISASHVRTDFDTATGMLFLRLNCTAQQYAMFGDFKRNR